MKTRELAEKVIGEALLPFVGKKVTPQVISEMRASIFVACEELPDLPCEEAVAEFRGMVEGLLDALLLEMGVRH